MSQVDAPAETALHFVPRVLPADGLGGLPPGFEPLRLVLLPGGTTVELKRAEASIGRHTQCDVRLVLPDVSRRHCRLLFQSGRWWVEDRHSLNGVYVNDERIETRVLQPGDRLRVGSMIFVVQPATTAPGELEGAVLRSIAAVLEPVPQRRAS